MFARQTIERAFNKFERALGQFSFVLIFDLDRHEIIKTLYFKNIYRLRLSSKDFVL
jgi:hypothetical protein